MCICFCYLKKLQNARCKDKDNCCHILFSFDATEISSWVQRSDIGYYNL